MHTHIVTQGCTSMLSKQLCVCWHVLHICVFIYIYIYIYIHTHTHTNIPKHTYTHTHKHAQAQAHTQRLEDSTRQAWGHEETKNNPKKMASTIHTHKVLSEFCGFLPVYLTADLIPKLTNLQADKGHCFFTAPGNEAHFFSHVDYWQPTRGWWKGPVLLFWLLCAHAGRLVCILLDSGSFGTGWLCAPDVAAHDEKLSPGQKKPATHTAISATCRLASLYQGNGPSQCSFWWCCHMRAK